MGKRTRQSTVQFYFEMCYVFALLILYYGHPHQSETVLLDLALFF